MIGVIDACFIIDWSRYRRKEILKKVFRKLYITESVLGELKSESTISFVGDMIADEYLALFDISSEHPDVIDLMSGYNARNIEPNIDAPEATALVLALVSGSKYLLSENKATYSASLFERFEDIEVWGAMDVIKEAILRGVLATSDPKKYFDEYSIDTSHSFKRTSLERCLKEIEKKPEERGEDQ
ncbi:MAG: type II toxin-antitoxin system VapC family toxin [Thermoplasmata archaeon]|nr:type II toxin-antitoxin system VapC family toxin [Thermoplasmata archaeon]